MSYMLTENQSQHQTKFIRNWSAFVEYKCELVRSKLHAFLLLGLHFDFLLEDSKLNHYDVPNFRGKQQDVFNNMGSMFAATVFLGVQNSSGVQPVVSVERTVFYREKAAGMYSALPYAFAQVFHFTL